MNRLELIKKAALKAKAKKLNTTVEELEFQETIRKLDERKAKIKAGQKKSKKILALKSKKLDTLNQVR